MPGLNLIELPDSQSPGRSLWLNAKNIVLVLPLESDDGKDRCSILLDANLDSGVVIDLSAKACIAKVYETIEKHNDRYYLTVDKDLYNTHGQ